MQRSGSYVLGLISPFQGLVHTTENMSYLKGWSIYTTDNILHLKGGENILHLKGSENISHLKGGENITLKRW